MTTFELGVDLCFAAKRWPQPESWTAIVRDELQLRCVEFDSDLLDPFCIPEDLRLCLAAETRRQVEDAGLYVHSYFSGLIPHALNLLGHPDERLRDLGIAWAEGAIRTAAAMGARGTGQHGLTTIAAPDCLVAEPYNRHVDRLVRGFQHLSFYAQEFGLDFVILEQMYTPNEPPYTIAQTQDILGRINQRAGVPVKLALDLGHAASPHYPHAAEDADPYEWMYRLGRETLVVHVQQTSPGTSQHWPFTGEYNARGIIDPKRTLEALAASGAGHVALIFEIFFSLSQNEERILADMRETTDYWKRALQAWQDSPEVSADAANRCGPEDQVGLLYRP
ncbi:MAG: sugar phosphate isomerase/epimerase family protein [Nitrososphaerales archaeon]